MQLYTHAYMSNPSDVVGDTDSSLLYGDTAELNETFVPVIIMMTMVVVLIITIVVVVFEHRETNEKNIF